MIDRESSRGEAKRNEGKGGEKRDAGSSVCPARGQEWRAHTQARGV